jgi:hypothetical protein
LFNFRYVGLDLQYVVDHTLDHDGMPNDSFVAGDLCAQFTYLATGCEATDQQSGKPHD